jgi:pantothenate synthetase
MPTLHAQFGGQFPQKWGDGLAYLSRNNVLSKTEEEFVSSLYKLISDEGVHPLIAEKEDARLTCNSVIEYALRFFRKVEKLGVKVAIAARP